MAPEITSETEKKSQTLGQRLDSYDAQFKWGQRALTGFIAVIMAIWAVASYVNATSVNSSDLGTKYLLLDKKLEEQVSGMKRTIDERKSERDKQFDDLKKTMVPRDSFDGFVEMYKRDRDYDQQMMQQLLELFKK